MSSEDFTLFDMMNVLKWYELIPNEIKILDQHVRTKIKFQGVVAVHEDLSERLIANLVESVSSKFSLASSTELQTSRSLLANRIVRTDQEVKVMHNLIEMIDKKMRDKA
jgi:predicted component of type VI protein secretion system